MSDHFDVIEYGGPEKLLLIDRHTRVDHILYYSMLRDPKSDLLHGLHIEKLKVFDYMLRRQTPSEDDLPDLDIDLYRSDTDSECTQSHHRTRVLAYMRLNMIRIT